EVDVGDTFTITVYDQVLTYQVDQIKVVLPEQTDDLRAVPGEDYVTLVTCTPTGINSHRLLVRGVRIDDAAAAATGQSLAVAPHAAGFPWWSLHGLAGTIAVLLVTRWIAIPRRPRPTQEAAS